MSYNLEIKAEAKIEIVDAAHYYPLKVKGIDVRFINHLEGVINIILNNPKTYKRVYKHFRQAALKKFPYVVWFTNLMQTLFMFIVFFMQAKIWIKK